MNATDVDHRTITVAVAQVICSADDLSQRLATTSSAIETAGGVGADLVVLPELAASGYRLRADHLGEVAEPADGSGPVLSAWCDAAKRYSIAVIGGFAENVDDGIANSAIVIDAGGEILGVYRKLHLFGAEHELLVPGDTRLPIFDVAGLRVGVLICYDLRFPEALRILALAGADLVAVPTAWVPGFDRTAPTELRIGQVDGVIVQANLSQVYVACADQVGAEADLKFLGRSLVVDPFGQVIAGPMSEDTPGMLTATVSPSEIEGARHRGAGIDPRSNRRIDVYADLLGYVAADPPR